MPHLVLEYHAALEREVQIDPVLQALGECAAATGVMDRVNIKLRGIGYRHFALMDGGDGFAHLNVHLLAGRTPQQKSALAEALRRCLVEQLPKVHALSVDIIDMDADAYRKRVLV